MPTRARRSSTPSRSPRRTTASGGSSCRPPSATTAIAAATRELNVVLRASPRGGRRPVRARRRARARARGAPGLRRRRPGGRGALRAARSSCRASRRKRKRGETLAPQERLAAILGGRDALLAGEELLLRARLDLDAGRTREAALQARDRARGAARRAATEKFAAPLRPLREQGGPRGERGARRRPVRGGRGRRQAAVERWPRPSGAAAPPPAPASRGLYDEHRVAVLVAQEEHVRHGVAHPHDVVDVRSRLLQLRVVGLQSSVVRPRFRGTPTDWPCRGGTRAIVVSAPAGATSTQRSPSP